MIWTFYPLRRAFIDDRNELNGQAKYETFFHVEHAAPLWREVLEKGGFAWVLIGADCPLAHQLRQSADWETLHEPSSGSTDRSMAALFRKRRQQEQP